MAYSTVLFDLDHTLLDSKASEAASFEHTLRSVGVAQPSQHFAKYDGINKALWAGVERGEVTPDDVKTLRFHQLAESIGLDVDPLAMAETFAAGLGANGELFPGAKEVLDALHGSVQMALVTNGLSAVQRARIDRLDLDRYFEAIVISAEVGQSKPGVAIFELTFQQLVQPAVESTLMIGDSLSSDIAGGRAFGVDTCWFNPDGLPAADPGPTHVVRTLAELPPLVLSA